MKKKFNKNNTILFLGPTPPPTTGHSLVCIELLDYLIKKKFQIKHINLANFSSNYGELNLNRIVYMLKVYLKILIHYRKIKRVYFTISQSLLGNLKDLVVFLIFHRKLHIITIHLHGGSLDKLLFNKYPFIKWLNFKIYKRLNNIIISGSSHLNIFAGLPTNKISIVKNFAPKETFINNKKIQEKFTNLSKIKILFLGNMDRNKGYLDLFNAAIVLNKTNPNLFEFNFAGRFDIQKEEESFIRDISNEENIFYHSVVNNKKKITLFRETHIFCLPTKLFEGQPISILEAYSAGCVVLTTDMPGIKDIFKNTKNGYFINESNIASRIKKIISDKSNLLAIANSNYKIALEEYNRDIYCGKIEELIIK